MQNIVQCFKKMKLSECFTFLAGGDVDKLCFSETKDDMHPYPIYANALTNKGLYGYSSKYKIKDECITITGRGDIGNVFYRKGFFTPIVRLIVAIPRENINAKFMSYACSKIRFFNETTGVPQLTVPQVQGYKVLVPPLAEQEKIAEILGTWDSAIEKLTALIAAKRLQKKGLMQKLLTAQIRLPGFTDEWQKVKLGDACTTFSGGTPSSSNKDFYVNGEIPFIRSGEIHFDKTELFITKKALNLSSSKIIEKGDLLLALYGATSGEASISKIYGAINQAILCIRSEKFVIFFLYSFLCFKKENIKEKYLQGGQGNLSAEIIKALKIPYPPLSEQKAIADILSKADEEIDLLTRKLDLIQSQKKGLMQQLLTGKIRVTVA